MADPTRHQPERRDAATATPRNTVGTFADRCRVWRRARGLSQLRLAELADTSQRHLCWLENGRSQPSRGMVLRLAGALELNLRERNDFLLAAGFAPVYRESALAAPHMAPIVQALDSLLHHHLPMPAFVLDRRWNVLKSNTAGDSLLSMVPLLASGDANAPHNLAALTFSAQGFRPLIRNADTVLPLFAQRLRQEAMAWGDPAFTRWVNEVLSATDTPLDGAPAERDLLPVAPIELAAGEITLSLFSVISTFGTPQDITTDELRIEAFYPLDSTTREFFATLSRSSDESQES